MKLHKDLAKIVFLGLVLCLGIGTEMQANSLYSRFGIGILRPYAGASYFGQGNIGIASYSPIALQYLNPASLAFLKRTRFEGSFLYEQADVKIGSAEGKFSDSGFNTLHIGIPMTRGYALSFGLMPYSIISNNYEDIVEGSYRSELVGTGGLERAFLRLSGQIGKRFSYGAGLDVYFGRLERTWRVFYDDASYVRTEDITSTTAIGMGGHAGILLQVSEKISLGAVMTAPATLSTKRQEDYVFRTENSIIEGEMKLPFIQGYGVNYRPNEKVTVLADFEAGNWGSLDKDDILGAETTNTTRYGIGLEYAPSRKLYASLLKKMSYRIGFNAGNLPYLLDGKKIDEKFFTAGLTLPYNAFNSQLEIGMEYGKRGSQSEIGSEETVFRFVFGIASGEKWFNRPKGRK
ncbi:MAG: hypothetical protein DWQ05_08980 [Calditrichaeota bacterium]|nr:MAG: hypothetical protein DWQ05_08980 [Calditrichota bacterium]